MEPVLGRTVHWRGEGMGIEGKLVEGRLVSRDNRFRVTVEVEGRHVWAHLPNSGRLGELLVPGRRLFLVERPEVGRKTGYDLSLVRMDDRWVSVDARLPNDLVEAALRGGRLAHLAGYPIVRREVSYGRSRFDFRLEASDRPACLVEVKSITLVIDGLGCFPDAVTLRGRRHVNELADAVEQGHRAAVVFVVQRDDARGVRPHDEADPDFGQALRGAAQRGVEIYAHACRVVPGQIEITHPLPVYLAPWETSSS
jgi:sugar fermentation stimulation protein A